MTQPWTAPEPGQQPPPPAKKSRRKWWIGGGIVLAVLVIAGVAGAGKKDDTTTPAGAAAPAATATARTGAAGPLQHPEDVAVTHCGVGDFGLLEAQIVVTNRSSKPSTYTVTVNFESTDSSAR